MSSVTTFSITKIFFGSVQHIQRLLLYNNKNTSILISIHVFLSPMGLSGPSTGWLMVIITRIQNRIHALRVKTFLI